TSGNPVNLATVILYEGTVGGSDAITVSGPMDWDGRFGPSDLSGSGPINVQSNLTINTPAGNPVVLDGRTLNLSGATVWTNGPGGTIEFYDGAVINNLFGASFTILGDDSTANEGGASGAFNNAGTLTKLAGTGTTTFGTAFNNSGTVQVQ